MPGFDLAGVNDTVEVLLNTELREREIAAAEALAADEETV